jgi:hypothetical protein
MRGKNGGSDVVACRYRILGLVATEANLAIVQVEDPGGVPYASRPDVSDGWAVSGRNRVTFQPGYAEGCGVVDLAWL